MFWIKWIKKQNNDHVAIKNQMELFYWLQQQLCNGEERERDGEWERDGERERVTGSGRTQAENSEKLQGSIFIPSFQLKVPRTNCEQIVLPSSSWACEHFISYILSLIFNDELIKLLRIFLKYIFKIEMS